MGGAQQPATVADALAMLEGALDALNEADAASLPVVVQAEVLRALGRAEAKQTAARARVLGAFDARAGYADDGQGSARVWLRWQTRVTRGAAAGAVGWMRRLAAHPVVAQALAAGQLSPSWAKAICDWADRLPAGHRQDADRILVQAAGGGAGLADLAGLAQQMYERSRQHAPDDGGDEGFDERGVALDLTFAGAGRLTGDLAPGCAAALAAVFEALAKPSGPEDLRTSYQRRHDALQDACQRLLGSKTLPGRAGQPTQAQVHITLAQLRALPGASEAEAAWRAAAARQHGWLTGAEAEAAACDATVAPVVTGHVDPAALDRLVHAFLAGHGLAVGPAPPTGLTDTAPSTGPGGPAPAAGSDQPASPAGLAPLTGPPDAAPSTGLAGLAQSAGLVSPTGPVQPTSLPGTADTRSSGCHCGGCTCPARTPLSAATLARLRGSLLAMAADVLSGPGGLAAWLRTFALSGGPGGSPS